MTRDHNAGRGGPYKRARARLLASRPVCVWCRVSPADTADHVPELASAPSPELWVGELVPACKSCNSRRGAQYTNRNRGSKKSRVW